MTTTSVPSLNVNFSDPEIVRDPWGLLEQIRSIGPAVYNDTLEAWMVPGYRDSAKMLANAKSFTSSKMSVTYAGLFGGDTMQFDDTSRHDRIKAVWSTRLRRESLDEVRPIVEDVVNARLIPFAERIRSGEAVEAREHLTRGIPTLVIARLMGLPEERFAEFNAWSDAMAGILGGILDPTEAGQETIRLGLEGTKSLNQYLAEVVEDRRAQPSDDLVGLLVGSEVAAVEMSQSELVANLTQLVFAGNETTANLMALALVALALHPDQRAALVRDRSLIPAAIEEINRWQTPVALKARHAQGGEADIAGVHIPDGAQVISLQIAANRDPSRWDRAAEFDIYREPQQHLGFGFGRHVCLGLNLARLEMIVWLNRLLDEVPEWNLTDDLDYSTNFFVRGPKRLSVVSP